MSNDEIRTQYRVVTVTKGEVTHTQSFDDLEVACAAMLEETGGAGLPSTDVEDLASHFEEFGPFGVDMGCGVKVELVSIKTVTIEPDWAGLREFVRAMARDDVDEALKFNRSLGSEGVDEGELRPIRKATKPPASASNPFAPGGSLDKDGSRSKVAPPQSDELGRKRAEDAPSVVCTGTMEDGQLVHNDGTCPIHEDRA
ncbi:MAG: hypothetical protein JSS68_15090 [Actinobacteria bacterium]|nr:hypothetical protein [Actinomycetota bacterium]